MRKHRLTIKSQFIALAAAFSLAGAAMAADPSANQAQPTAQSEQSAQTKHKRGHHHDGKRGHRGMGHAVKHAGLWVPGYGPLKQSFVDELKLTPKQIELVDQAKAARKAQWEEKRSERRASLNAKKDHLSDGKLDPRAAAEALHQSRAATLEQQRLLDEKWLAVWDALDKPQREQIATHMAERAKKLEARKAEHKARRDARKQEARKQADDSGTASTVKQSAS